MRLAGKVALVTGGGSGIGRATAELLAREKARVAVLGRTEPDVRATAERINAEGGEALPLPVDLTDRPRLESAINEAGERWGRLDVVFANAGVNGVWAPIEDLSPEEWDSTLGINLTGTFLTIKYAVPWLKRQGGSIIIDSSVNGTRVFSNVGATAYAVSKAGQVALAKMLALELAEHRIRVNVICPGPIATKLPRNTTHRNLERFGARIANRRGITPPLTGGKPGSAEEVARLVLFLASEESSLITGTEVWIDGGYSLMA